ncbi:MAG: ARMT1-like domain-containing protein [Nitrososphaerota archaeon]|nr:ARMT1-like domain-containing protein [Nitrososphaerota archaeon]
MQELSGLSKLKPHPECILCLVKVRGREILSSSLSLEDKRRCLECLLLELSRLLSMDTSVPVIATKLFRLVRKLTGIDDPYAVEKRLANDVASRFRPIVEDWVDSTGDLYQRFRRACISTVVGNTIDVGASEHRFSLDNLLDSVVGAELTVDDTKIVFDMICKRRGRITYVCDNAGEIVFDSILIKILEGMGWRVVVLVKSEPYQNDAMLNDALEAGIPEVASEVLSVVPGTSGLILSELPVEALEELKGSDIVFMKGMANLETLEDVRTYVRPVVCLLQAKCTPIARILDVPVKSNIVKLFKA